jgi:hypothetical protein
MCIRIAPPRMPVPDSRVRHVRRETVKRLFWAGVVLLLYAGEARAVRLEFIAQYKGERVAGVEICFWRAGEETDPVSLFASSPEVRCVSADDVLEIPVGRWLYYLRHGSDLVHFEPSIIRNESHSLDEHGYKEDANEMVRAGTIDVSALVKPEGAGFLALYISNDRGETRPMLVPIPRGTKRVMVPAGMALLVVAIRDGQVVDASAPFEVEAGAVRTIGAFSHASQRATLIAWVVFPKEARKPAGYWQSLGAPAARLEMGRSRLIRSSRSLRRFARTAPSSCFRMCHSGVGRSGSRARGGSLTSCRSRSGPLAS